MKLIKTIAVTCLFALSLSAFSIDLKEYTEINRGLFQKTLENGTVIQVATTDEARSTLDSLSIETKLSAINELDFTTLKTATAWNKTTGSELCGTTNLYPEQWRQFEINGSTATNSGAALVGAFIGPFPPQPSFTYTRVKTRLLTYYADQTRKAVTASVERDPRSALNNSAPTMFEEPDLLAAYSYSETSTNIDLTGASFVKWVVRTEHLVDNPSSNIANCFEHVTIVTKSPLIPLN